MKKLSLQKIATIAFLLLLSASVHAQETGIIEKLNSIIKPIQTLKPDSSFEDIDFLTGVLQEKEIVALGEVTHGTKEVYVYKDRLIRYLVSKLNYKAIAFEADYNGLALIDQYINAKIDSTTISPNYKSLFNWLRAYNQTKGEQDKVHVFGLEMRDFNAAIDKILIDQVAISPQDKEVLLTIKKTPFDQISKGNLAKFRLVCMRLPENLHQKMLLQLIDNYHNFTGSGKIGARDKFMAENTIAIKHIMNKKLIIWAHNGHVAKTTLYGKPSMGAYLKQAYNDQYYVVATDVNKGNVRVIQAITKKKTVGGSLPLYYPEVNTNNAYEYYFKQCKYKNFILTVQASATDHELKSFLAQPKEMRMIGAFSFPVNKKLSISSNFDLIVYFDETNSI